MLESKLIQGLLIATCACLLLSIILTAAGVAQYKGAADARPAPAPVEEVDEFAPLAEEPVGEEAVPAEEAVTETAPVEAVEPEEEAEPAQDEGPGPPPGEE